MAKLAKGSSLSRSFFNAFRGLVWVFRYERNARIHLVAAVAVLAVGLWLRLSAWEVVAVVMAVLVVFLGEIFNTAIEKILDMIEPHHNPKVGRIKDMAAGAVLVAAVAAVVIGGLIFWPHAEAMWPR